MDGSDSGSDDVQLWQLKEKLNKQLSLIGWLTDWLMCWLYFEMIYLVVCCFVPSWMGLSKAELQANKSRNTRIKNIILYTKSLSLVAIVRMHTS